MRPMTTIMRMMSASGMVPSSWSVRVNESDVPLFTGQVRSGQGLKYRRKREKIYL